MPRIPAKRQKPNKRAKKSKFPLDTISEKRRRGRHPKVIASWVRGRAENNRLIFDRIWDHVGPRLLRAETREEVLGSFDGAEVGRYAVEFVTLADLILQVVRGPDFPKRSRKAQVNFLADSIAGDLSVTPRTARDICARERARIKRAHHIIRYEFWVECSCGYKGRSQNHACPKCEATITLAPQSPFWTNSMFD
jgi:hypothetical protein